MPRTAVQIILTPAEREQLERNVKSQTVERRLFLRSKIVLMSAEGKECIQIAELLEVSEKTCRKWRNRFAKERMAGLSDLQRSGAPEIFTPEERQEIIRIACEPPKDIRRWTLADIVERVREKFGREFSVETIRLILRSADAGSTGCVIKRHNNAIIK